MLPPVFGVLFDGIAYGMLLFLLSVGLTVTLGMMNFVNLAHCAFAMVGGFTTVWLMAGPDFGITAFTFVIPRLGVDLAFSGIHFFSLPPFPFFATLPFAFLFAAALSVVFERVLYRRLYRASDLDQVLLTIGIAFVSVAVAAYYFGTTPQLLSVPDYLRGSFDFMGLNIGAYRLFLVGIGIVVTITLVVGLEYTRFGAQVRAAVDNQRMARGLGIDVDRTFAITFALGSGLAGLGGALAIEIVGLDYYFAFAYLVFVLIVVSVGGLGSIIGSFAAAIVIGVSDIAGKYYVPQLGSFLIYLVMLAVLMWRPAGLFGKR
jgi:branched-chain amino acid transport system permease protein